MIWYYGVVHFSGLVEGRNWAEPGSGRQRGGGRGRPGALAGQDPQDRGGQGDHDAQARGAEGAPGVPPPRTGQELQGGRPRQGHQWHARGRHRTHRQGGRQRHRAAQ